jgi:hypothetical protein
MVLSLIRNGKLNTNDFIDFAEHSLLQMDMNDKKVRLLKNQQDVFEKIQTLNTKLMPFLKTPRDVIRQYMEYKRMLPTLVNKKRKDTERHIQTIMELHKDCIVDVERFEGLTKLEQELEDINNQIQYIDNFVNDQVNSICSILLKYEFIERSENGSFQFTPKGHFASQIGEVHPLIMTDVLFKTLCLENMSPIQLISYLSCFTDVRIHPDIVKHFPDDDLNPFMKEICEQTKCFLKLYEDEESMNHLCTGFSYHKAIVYDLMEEMIHWANAETESECKLILQNIEKDKKLCTGDFVKAVLKIAAISKELANICEFEGKLSWMHILRQVDSLILKYVCTTQSLYV